MRLIFFCCAVGLFTAGLPGVLAGLLVGGVVAFFLEGGSESTRVFTIEEEKFLPIMAIFAAAAGSSNKAKARAIAIVHAVFPQSNESRVRFLFDTASKRNTSAENAGKFIKDAPTDLQYGIARDTFSVLHADGLSLDSVRTEWLVKLIRSSNLPQEFWEGVDAFYRPCNASPSRGAWLNTLELDAQADAEQIKKAYWRLCQDYHPDKLSGASAAIHRLAEEKLKEINEAYDLLTQSPSRNLMVRQQDGDWVGASDAADGTVLLCILCDKRNRVSRDTIPSARCGACYALLAFPKEFVADLMRQG